MYFSCAPQAIQLGDVSVRFEVDPTDTSICRMAVGDHIATFQRNGPLLSVAEPEKEPADERHDEPIPVGAEPTPGDVHPPARNEEPLAVSG